MSELRIHRRRLPHWRLNGAIYFVTWRLARGVPDLDGAERDQVLSAVLHCNGSRYVLYAAVVLNDHVHVLVEPADGHRPEDIIRSWKSFTANRLHGHRRSGHVWQPEYWDRIVRDEREFAAQLRCVVGNPFTRWPGIESYPWLWVAA